MAEPNRVVLVVGGASGIGWASARAFAAEGARVVIADLNESQAQQRAAELGPGHWHHGADVTDEETVATLVQTVTEREPRLDAVVNCAGIGVFGPITTLAADAFRHVVDVCLTGAFFVIKHAARRMAAGGSIVSITSLNARQPAAGLAAYCAAKAGLAMLTQVAALELGERGIRVNAISPGLTQTPLVEPILRIPGVHDDFLDNTPLGRKGTPEDVAFAATFLSSPQASWITGEVLDINGGAHTRRYPDLVAHIARADRSTNHVTTSA